MAMNKKSSFKTYLFSGAGVVIMFLILVAVYVISGAVKNRFDLTSDRLFTLSDGTRKILKKLDTPVQIRFYCTQNSSTMPVFLKTYAQRVEDLLEEYRKASNGNIEIKKMDPQPDSDAEDSANLDGVEGQMAAGGEKIYLGIAINCLDEKVSVPFLSPDRERQLEYDVSRAISQVTTTQKPVVGVMSALQVFGAFDPMAMQMGRPNRQDPWVFVGELKRDYTVKQVEMTAEKIDDDIQVLVVVYPKDITDKTQYAIDQFVLRGGKLVAFLDPLSLVDSRTASSNPMQRNMGSGATLDKLLKAWGIEMDKDKVVADLNYAARINRGGGQPEVAPAVLALTQEAVDTNDVVTSQIDNLVLPFPGGFTGTPTEGLKKTVLISTTKSGQLVDKMMAEFSGEQLSKEFAATGKPYALALRLTGKFKTAFPEGQPKDVAADPKAAADKKETPGQASLKESKGDGAVVLVADADMLYDQFCVQVQSFFGQKVVTPINANLNFLQNVVDQMGGDQNLIGVRSRASMSRPFTVVKRMQTEAEEKYRATIKDLEKNLADTQQKLNEMQTKKEGGQRFILSPEQQNAIQQFRQDEARVKKELKDVRKSLRRDIESLETRLEWINIAGMPFLVTLSGIGLALLKRKKTAAK
jgi:ABC-type uncharacterized transport system involved in gliding motility auxiliary subunit